MAFVVSNILQLLSLRHTIIVSFIHHTLLIIYYDLYHLLLTAYCSLLTTYSYLPLPRTMLLIRSSVSSWACRW